jgi:hypothetical protein
MRNGGGKREREKSGRRESFGIGGEKIKIK